MAFIKCHHKILHTCIMIQVTFPAPDTGEEIRGGHLGSVNQLKWEQVEGDVLPTEIDGTQHMGMIPGG